VTAEPDPANSDSAEEPPAQTNQHVEPVTAESDTTQRTGIRRTSAEPMPSSFPTKLFVPPDAAGQRAWTGPDGQVELMGEHICWGLGLESLQWVGFESAGAGRPAAASSCGRTAR